MRLAEHPVLVDPELFAGRQLSLAGVAGEAGQVVDLLLGLPDPVRRGDDPATFEAFHAEESGRDNKENVNVKFVET